ncbi:hypothetical protein SCLCIDRAFT_1216305 [Scleroderma citrinum Foug A]|uniref:Uncharacterized protein n=1 Tax=Scleroderma citrinum Foug A TaxID=1036808 RepID=A0A0C2ZH63_9AGAM|nr:hypothetical protein SCLCIDRAFT_1216305 [Scleroderma citrinum Foug A]
MRVSIALLITALVAPVLATPAPNLEAFNAVVKRNVAPMDAVDLSKREVSLGSVSRDIDATSGNIYARDGNSQLSELLQGAVAQGSLNPSDAESLLSKISALNNPQVTSQVTAVLSELLGGLSGPGSVASRDGGSSGGLLGLVLGLLDTVLGLLGGL